MQRLVSIFFLFFSILLLQANQFNKNSIVTMADLSSKNISELQKGDSVFALNLNTKKTEPIIVESIRKITLKESIILLFSDSLQINVSKTTFFLGNHSWLTVDKATNHNSILKTKQLNKSDFIVCLNSDNSAQSVPIEGWNTNKKTDDFYIIEFKNTTNEYAFVVNNIFTSAFHDFFD